MKKDIDLKSVQAVERAIQPDDNTITLSTGVVLRGKQAPPLALVSVLAAFPRPKPPVYMNKQMGREMENPDDPDYIEQVRSWQMESSSATLNALIMYGTELVSKPKRMPGPEDDDWLDEYRLLGLPIYPSNKYWRYLIWIKVKAATADTDLNLVKEVVGRLSGVPESKVKAAEEFPGGDENTG